MLTAVDSDTYDIINLLLIKVTLKLADAEKRCALLEGQIEDLHGCLAASQKREADHIKRFNDLVREVGGDHVPF